MPARYKEMKLRRWSANFAYAVGLITTDGSLSKDGRHITFTSKDREMINNFQKSLSIQNHVGRKSRGKEKEKRYYVVHVGDVRLYRFLLHIGLMPNKSKIIGEISIPKKYFFHFLRGHFDGDGTFYSYWDPRWKSSFLFYTVFISASRAHIEWLRKEIFLFLRITGHVTKGVNTSVYCLKFGKKESRRLLKKLYPRGTLMYLKRKRTKVEKALCIDRQHAQVEKLVNSPA